MSTIKECAMIDKAYRKYYRGRFVEEEDIWAVKHLAATLYLRLLVKDGMPYAIDDEKMFKMKHFG